MNVQYAVMFTIPKSAIRITGLLPAQLGKMFPKIGSALFAARQRICLKKLSTGRNICCL